MTKVPNHSANRNFLHLSMFLFLFLCFSCTEKENVQNGNLSISAVERAQVKHTDYDTIVSVYSQAYVDSIPLQYDTTFLIDNKQYTLQVNLKLKGNDTVYYDETPVLKKDTSVQVYRYTGRDISYQFRLLDAKNDQLWEKYLTKKDYMEELGSIVAQSNMQLPQFKTYLSMKKQLILTQHFWVPDSDVGVEGILFFDLKGNHDLKYHSWYGSSEGDCEVVYSPDSSFLLTCSEIISSNGKSTSIDKEQATIAGNMFIGNAHVFVSYAFNKDTSALGGRLYDGSGNIVKEFRFDGYGGALSYELPHCYLKQFGNYYFADETNKCMLVIPENEPKSLKRIPFSELQFEPSQLDLDTTVVLYMEASEHRFGIDSLGDVRSHQIKVGDDEWMFLDQDHE